MNSPEGSAQEARTFWRVVEASFSFFSEVETTAWRVAERLEAREERRSFSVVEVVMSERSAGRGEASVRRRSSFWIYF